MDERSGETVGRWAWAEAEEAAEVWARLEDVSAYRGGYKRDAPALTRCWTGLYQVYLWYISGVPLVYFWYISTVLPHLVGAGVGAGFGGQLQRTGGDWEGLFPRFGVKMMMVTGPLLVRLTSMWAPN